MYGNTGTILRIDLSSSNIITESSAPYLKKYLGGRSLNHILLFQDIDVAKVGPFDPENEIIYSSGTLGGTCFPSSGRIQANFIAPLPISGWGASNAGGDAGPTLKFAGYDAVVIRGKAEKPSYIYIEDDTVELKSAEDLWGKGMDEVTDILNNRYVGCEYLLIGPAGENLVNYACVKTKLTNALGRNGLGAVMGSKNLKGIVIKGSKGVQIFDPKKLIELCKQAKNDMTNPDFGFVHGLTFKVHNKYGLPGFTRLIGQTGMTPRKNWQECGIWENDVELTEGLVNNWGIGRTGCMTCPIVGKGVYRVEEPEYACFGHGPEYETTTALGHKCLEPRGKVILKLNTMCNDWGLDTVEMGNMFSTLMEWYEKGIIDENFTDGIPMYWGNGDGMIELLPKVCKKEGCGKKLAKGPYWLGKELGEEALKSVYHQKGVCATGVETRSTTGSMLQFALSPRGSHHLSGLPTAEWVNVPELAQHTSGYVEAGELQSYHPEAKSALVRFYENLFEIPDSLGICKFPWGHLGYWHDSPEAFEKMRDYICDGIYYTTGIKYSKQELEEIGERAYQIERAIICLRGIRREHDMPNWKCLNEPCPGEHPVGPNPLPPIDEQKYSKLLDKYYEIRGWTKNGIPKKERLEELGLNEVATSLEKHGLYK